MHLRRNLPPASSRYRDLPSSASAPAERRSWHVAELADLPVAEAVVSDQRFPRGRFAWLRQMLVGPNWDTDSYYRRLAQGFGTHHVVVGRGGDGHRRLAHNAGKGGSSWSQASDIGVDPIVAAETGVLDRSSKHKRHMRDVHRCLGARCGTRHG